MLLLKRLIRRKVLVLGLLAFMFCAHAQTSSYITNHKIFASLLSKRYGIPASVILAVATVESAAGSGPAAKVLNNHFGIVGKNDIVNDRGHKSRYKQYSNEYASYIDFCQMISRKHFYHKLKNNHDSKAWIKAMSHSGYSEQPEVWEKKINGMISANRL